MALSREEFETSLKIHGEEGGGLEVGSVRFTRGLRRKRILFSNSDESPVRIQLKRSKCEMDNNRSMLESLHQDILIRILCHVDHDDLGTLKCVSKNIRNAVLEAKKSHFDYSTPRKTLPFRDSILILEEDHSNSNLSNQDCKIQPPNAPSRRRFINGEMDLSKISMVLFK